jgi:hypothetical protein
VWKIQDSDIRELKLRQIHIEKHPDGGSQTTEVIRATVRVLCACGQWIASSPAFEIWLVIWYAIDDPMKAFTLRRMKYNPNEIKQRGKWE